MRGALLVGLIALSGCTVGPNYKRPQIAMPAEFRGAPPAAAGAASVADSKWQDLFPDPTLNRMVTAALEDNFDLRIAAEQIEEARAQLGITRANQYPFLDLQGSLTGARQSSVGSITFIRPGTPIRATYTSVSAALSWELDLFGRLRRLTEASRAQFLASQEGRRAVTVALVATVIDTYFQLLEQDSELEISHKTEGIARDSLKLVELRRSRGAASGLDVRQAEQLLYTATVRSAAAERAIAQTENQLSLLQGSVPGPQARSRKLEEIAVPAQAPPGLPAAILERRPDIRVAEQNLIAANAQIGAARALYFPQFALTASAGGQSRYLLDLLTSPARVYSVAPAAILSIFHAGQIRNQVRFSEAQQRELLVTYQKTIYNAFREVSDALIAYDRTREQLKQEELLVNALTETVHLSTLRYQGGLDSYLQVLVAERSLFEGQIALAQFRLQELLAYVQVYRALGGGWQ